MPRPPKTEAEKRKAVVQLRVTDAERAEIKRAADLDRRNVSDWLRRIALDAARKANERAGRRAGRG
jgi:uncharacterized protein (DUF1778 family)